eukprot:evm.model.scf_577EXC.10 EVM.evm.TU.scf_577EXC.10   scf_577EXC:70796-73927(-)
MQLPRCALRGQSGGQPEGAQCRGFLAGRPCPFRRVRCRQAQRAHGRASLRTVCETFVPSDSFGGISPERTAANALRKLFTFCAVKAILAQLEGSGLGRLGSYDANGHRDLLDAAGELNSQDCDEWLASLMKRNKNIAMRVMEVRSAYCAEDFEWNQCKKVADKDIKDANLRLLREHMVEVYEKTGVTGDSMGSEEREEL